MYQPLPNNIEIRKSPIHGLGIFATKDILPRTKIGMSHYKLDSPVILHRTLDSKTTILRNPLGAFVNHQTRANGEIVMGEKVWHLYSGEDYIYAGDEITVDYTLYPCGTEQDVKNFLEKL